MRCISSFLSTPSARRATCPRQTRPGGLHNFYPRPPRGGRLARGGAFSSRASISIHALREEGDDFLLLALSVKAISIHALREEGDRRQQKRHTMQRTFLSTPSARRATPGLTVFVMEDWISIHALREEGDAVLACSCTSCGVFLSTPSARRATRHQIGPRRSRYISIHALREEGDSAATGAVGCWVNFYPRPPRGGRPSTASAALPPTNFYPRPPRGGRLV